MKDEINKRKVNNLLSQGNRLINLLYIVFIIAAIYLVTLIGDKLQIQCYKHDGSLHRKWDEAVVLDIFDNYLVFGNNSNSRTSSNYKFR